MRGAALTRREALRLGALGAVALGTPILLRPETARAADIEVAAAWVHDSDLITRAPYRESDSEQVLWTTVMRVDDKLAAPEARWYMWHSTHDTPILRRYTAPSIAGPWTERPICALPLMPSPWDSRHRQCPDIAWDPVGRRFLASIHSLASSPRLMQNTFMLQSTDGANWSFVTGKPAVPLGAKESFDAYAIDYGRFLRDPHGNLVRPGGLYHWYYRGTRKLVDQATGTDVEVFELGVATSSDLVSWTKTGKAILDPGAKALFGLGSALWLNGVANLVWTVCPLGASPRVHLQRSAPLAPRSFPQPGPGSLIYADASPRYDGPSLAVEGDRQYMILGAAKSVWVEGTPKTTWNQDAVRLIRAAV